MNRTSIKLMPRSAFLLAFLILTPVFVSASPGQRSFAAPEDAMNALIRASQHNDSVALSQIFGPEGREIAQSGDHAEDKADREQFARLALERLKIIHDPANPDQVTFVIGDDEWPFPVPLIRQNGKWTFDSAKGKVEMLAHRIGENEYDTLETCRAFVEAELKYASSPHDGSLTLQYAQRIFPSTGKDDGLLSGDSPQALVPLAFAKAVTNEERNSSPAPYHGYYFRILKEQGLDSPGGELHYIVEGKMIGGFALIAWPAEYGSTGVQTFIVNHQGLVYSKDLGRDTTNLAAEITSFNPDHSWRPVELD